MKYSLDFQFAVSYLKGGKISLVVSALLAGSTMSFAAPTGGVVTTGSATINQSGSVTTINQSTNKASINWNSFSIAPTETVNFVQPSSQSVTLNRVVGTTQSLIQGAMNANGQVFLLNPNGVLFSKDATINVGGLVASTLNIIDANFQAGNYVFEGNSQNSIINMGSITANNGYVAMMGKTVQNEGTIVATMGNVQMASGEKISLNLNGNSLVKLTIDQGTMDALVENKGLIKADGGQVYLTTQALHTILDGMVNNTGIIEAQTLNDVTGKVILYAHGGTANISGTIDASGGFVETSGDIVKIADDFKVKAKDWLIDPVDFKIAASGGNITGTALSANLANTNVTILSTNGTSGTNGDIFVNDTITWSSDYDLTLNAQRNIYINENITATGTGGKLSLLYGQAYAGGGASDNYTIANGAAINLQSGQNFSTKKGSSGTVEDYTVINGADNSAIATALQNISSNLSGKFALGANVDLTGISWTPIGTWGSKFTGLFDGLGHTIEHLTYNTLGSTADVGLFGTTDTASVLKNIGLTNVSIIGGNNSGALAGVILGKVYNAYSSGSIAATERAGGLIGNIQSGATLSTSYSTVSVSGGTSGVGGLVGYNLGAISNSYATGNVTDNTQNEQTGGVVGYNNGTISNSYFAGTINNTKGFIGSNANSSGISSSFTNTTDSLGTAGVTVLTAQQFADTSNFSTWDSDIWKFGDATVEGYGIASRPFLAITTDADKPTMTALFAGGYGTSANPYTITTAAQLQNIGNDYVVGQNYYYNLSNNINLSGVTWTSIGRNG